NEYACSALASLAVLCGADTARGQAGAEASVPAEAPRSAFDYSATSSTEQGQAPLTESFETGREWRLEKRRGALQDTQFRFNFRTAYFDRENFDGSESQAFTIGGWVGLKTG